MEVDGISNGSFSEAKEEPQIEQDQFKKCSGGSETPSQTGCFDCNICLDFAVEPIVTLCGHLYCWPCIYQWLHTDNISAQQCPVCKASLSEDSFIPLYGRHHHHQVRQHEHHHHHHHSYNNLPSSNGFTLSSPSFGSMNRVMHSTVGGVLGGMTIAVLPWLFGNQRDVASFQFSSASPYYFAGNGGSPRLRRQEMVVESLLHQIWLFLFCCATLCLLLF